MPILRRKDMANVLAYLRYISKRVKRPALVLDIDQTVLLHEAQLCSPDMGCCEKIQFSKLQRHDDVYVLYLFALVNDISVFFVTARKTKGRRITKRQLTALGYNKYKELYLRPEGHHDFANYKRTQRQRIEQEGYTIVLNIGDQHSDLHGGHALRTLKLDDLPVIQSSATDTML